MKCTKASCFAFEPKMGNNCDALHTVEMPCGFYKTKEELKMQRDALRLKGKPYYNPAKNKREMRVLEVLLKDEKTTDLDKT